MGARRGGGNVGLLAATVGALDPYEIFSRCGGSFSFVWWAFSPRGACFPWWGLFSPYWGPIFTMLGPCRWPLFSLWGLFHHVRGLFSTYWQQLNYCNLLLFFYFFLGGGWKTTNNKPNFIIKISTFKCQLHFMISLLFCWYKQKSN